MLHFGSLPNTYSLLCSSPPVFEGIRHNLTPLKWQNRHRSAAATPGCSPHLCPLRGQSSLCIWYHLYPSGVIYPGDSSTEGLQTAAHRGASASGTPFTTRLHEPSEESESLGLLPEPACPSFAPCVILILSRTPNCPFM